MTYYETYSKCQNIDELFALVATDKAFAQDDSDERCIMDAAWTVVSEHTADILAWPYEFMDLQKEGE